ncbi:uncharacterized protein LOC120003673 isoform X1 [Tripterygium wilfordii]|uniref:uncharacterized protein LOC120003673 isoform X1 n=1 Tax=Tripterygium wilfordii TaxID=458696 RepID=UPI0018F8515B|nr:uncharacterized protein LOC120003673 isoform X1 [Tripterygium wilfordii]
MRRNSFGEDVSELIIGVEKVLIIRRMSYDVMRCILMNGCNITNVILASTSPIVAGVFCRLELSGNAEVKDGVFTGGNPPVARGEDPCSDIMTIFNILRKCKEEKKIDQKEREKEKKVE